VRAGGVPLDEVLDRLDDAASALEQACERADVPERSDIERVDAFVVRAYRRAWDEGLTA
jgi:hypothetical protein